MLPQSDTEAYLWAKKAAEQGLAKAEYAVGYFTEVGIGTIRDEREAVIWFKRAAEHGDRRAVTRLRTLGGVEVYPSPPTSPTKGRGSILEPIGGGSRLNVQGGGSSANSNEKMASGKQSNGGGIGNRSNSGRRTLSLGMGMGMGGGSKNNQYAQQQSYINTPISPPSSAPAATTQQQSNAGIGKKRMTNGQSSGQGTASSGRHHGVRKSDGDCAIM